MLQPIESKKRRKHAPEETRAQLMRASAKCFAAVGYGRTQVSDVTREAGVAVGTFYVHFTDKEEALLTVLKSHFEPIREGLQALKLRAKAERNRELSAALQGVIGFVLQQSLQDRDGFLAWYRHGHDVSENADRLVMSYYGFLEQAIAEELATAPGLNEQTRVSLSQGIVGLVLSLINRQLLTGEPSEEEAIRISLLMSLGGVTAARGQTSARAIAA